MEAPRGEVIHHVITGENCRPHRWKVRAPTFANLQALGTTLKGMTLADVPITLGSMDPCFSCTERVQVVDVRSHAVRIVTSDELDAIAARRWRPVRGRTR